MLVVLGIFTVITGVVIADLPSFRDKTILELVGQEIAVTIRQAQSYGVGTRSFSNAFPSHGVYLNEAGSLTLFADGNANNKFDTGSACGTVGTECIELYNLPGGVSRIFLKNCSSIASCIGAPSIIAPLNIVFQRPKLDAVFVNGSGVTQSFTHVGIIIQSNRDNKKRCQVIRVLSTGQIIAEAFVDSSTCL